MVAEGVGEETFSEVVSWGWEAIVTELVVEREREREKRKKGGGRGLGPSSKKQARTERYMLILIGS